jgi:hypothetical protein
LVEYVEMYEWGLHETNLGNQYGRIVAQRCILAAGQIQHELERWYKDIDTVTRLNNVKKYIERRLAWENN